MKEINKTLVSTDLNKILSYLIYASWAENFRMVDIKIIIKCIQYPRKKLKI